MNVCSLTFPDHIDYGYMYSYSDHKEIIPELKKAVNVEGYVLIKRCDLSIIRVQSNTRPVPIMFFQHLNTSTIDTQGTGVSDTTGSVEEDADYFF